jgi:hypothetical protein
MTHSRRCRRRFLCSQISRRVVFLLQRRHQPLIMVVPDWNLLTSEKRFRKSELVSARVRRKFNALPRRLSIRHFYNRRHEDDFVFFLREAKMGNIGGAPFAKKIEAGRVYGGNQRAACISSRICAQPAADFLFSLSDL